MKKFIKPLLDIVCLDDDIICTSEPSQGHEESGDPTIIVDDE